MTHEHRATAIAVKTKIIKNILLALALLSTRLKLFMQLSNRFSTAPATNWNYHFVSSLTVRFLPHSSSLTMTVRLTSFLPAHISNSENSIILEILRMQFLIKLSQCFCNSQTSSLGLTIRAAARHVNININPLRNITCDEQRLLNLRTENILRQSD